MFANGWTRSNSFLYRKKTPFERLFFFNICQRFRKYCHGYFHWFWTFFIRCYKNWNWSRHNMGITIISHYSINEHIIIQWICAHSKIARFFSKTFSTVGIRQPTNIYLSHILRLWHCHYRHDQSVLYNLGVTVFVNQKWLKQFPELLTYNRTFLSNFLKVRFYAHFPKRDALISLGCKLKFSLTNISKNFISKQLLLPVF